MQPVTKPLKPRVRIFAFAKNALFARNQLRCPTPRNPPPPAPEFRGSQFNQRLEPVDKPIAAAPQLNPLTVQETQSYLERELQDKGWNNDPQFDASVFQLINQFSEGVPNRINTICNYLLIQSFVEQRHRINLADARAIVEDLMLETSITPKPQNNELPVFQLPRAAPVELPKQEFAPGSNTSDSQRQKAQFESRNVSPKKPLARRGKW